MPDGRHGASTLFVMAVVHELSRADARRVAVRAQLLTKDRPTDLVETVRRLTMLQIEPTSAIAPSAELVMWSRRGRPSRPQELWDALDEQRLIELHQTLRVPEDLALFRAEMAEWPGSGKLRPWQEDLRDWVEANNACRLDILERLRADGPLPSSELPDTCVVPWASSGWNNNRNLRMMIDKLVQRGEVAAAGGTGRDRLWDLASRIYPDDPVPPGGRGAPAARRAGGSAHSASPGPRAPSCPSSRSTSARPARPPWSRGSRGQWRVDPAHLGQPFAGRAALLSPFDRLVADRKRLDELFEFDYILEMYKPVAAPDLGRLRAPHPVRRPVGREARRQGRPQGRGAARRGHPPGRAVHQDHDRRGRPRDHGPGPLARAGARPRGLSPCTTPSRAAGRSSSKAVRTASTSATPTSSIRPCWRSSRSRRLRSARRPDP